MLILGEGKPWRPALWRYQPVAWYQRGTQLSQLSLSILR
jgi:hypothetical protein